MKRASSDNVTRWIVRAFELGACALMAFAYVGCGNSNIFGHGSSNSQVSGTVVVATVSGSTVTPSSTVVPGALVWLEQVPSSGNVLNFVQSTSALSNGQFQFNSVPSGTYELVTDVLSMPSSGVPSNATITTTVTVGSSGASTGLKIPLVAESGSAATIQGLFTSSPVTNSGPTIGYAGLQSFTIPGSSTGFAQIPYMTGTNPSPPLITTSVGVGTNCQNFPSLVCPANELCACYKFVLPASNPVVGAANSSGASYSVPASGNASYSIIGVAQTNSCSPTEIVSGTFTAGSGVTTTAPEIDFQNCS